MSTIATRRGAVLRPVVEADLPATDAIAIACWTPIFASFRELLGEEIYQHLHAGRWEAGKCAQVRGHFANHPGEFDVVELAGEVIAFVTYRLDHERSVGTIGNNGVAPSHAGQGWGTFMYRHVLDRFRREGLKFACVGTGLDVGHAAARRAYEAVGFNRQKPMVEYWQDLRERQAGSEPQD